MHDTIHARNGKAPQRQHGDRSERQDHSPAELSSSRSLRPSNTSNLPGTFDAAANLTTWLGVVTEPGQVVQMFAQGLQVEGLSVPIDKAGYYDTDHFDALVRDALEHSASAKGIYVTLNPVHPDLLARRRNRLGTTRQVQCATDADIVRRRLLLIDFDPVRPGGISSTDAEKQLARERMQQVGKYLRANGWPMPLIVDSGNGFHLHFLIDLPSDDGGLIQRVLQALANRFSDDKVDLDTTVYNASRLVKLPGTMACKGDSTPDRPHRLSQVTKFQPAGLSIVPQLLLEKLATEVSPCSAQIQKPVFSSTVLSQAAKYLATLPPAVSGKKGHNQLFSAACRLVIDFDLSPNEALPLLREYNQRCQPPWDETDLVRKLGEADQQPWVRGRLLSAQGSEIKLELLDGPKFVGVIPDFALAATNQFLLPLDKWNRVYPIAYSLLSFCAWFGQASNAPLPDVLVRQIRWGARYPRNWRRQLEKELGRITAEDQDQAVICDASCVFHGLGVRHQHFLQKADATFGALEGLAPKNEQSGIRHFHVCDSNPDWKKVRSQLIRNGYIYPMYWPIALFGRSPKVGLTAEQQRLMFGVLRELTRDRKHSRRADRALVIEDARIISSSRSGKLVRCPLLDEGQRYVVFGGNGYRGGRGYQFKGKKLGGWLTRAGYTREMQTSESVTTVRAFFSDLQVLADTFGLVCVGHHHQDREWKSLDEMWLALNSVAGRRWLSACCLRVFVDADYLLRWRHWFAKRLGFSWIPGGELEPPETAQSAAASGDKISNGMQLRRWMDERGLSQQGLAKGLRMARETINRHVNGKRNAAGFWTLLNEYIQRIGRST